MSTKKATFGFVLIALGFLLLLRSLGILSSGDLSRFIVPLLFIGLGIWLIIRRRRLDDRAVEPQIDTPPPPPPPPPPPGGAQPPPYTQPPPFSQPFTTSNQSTGSAGSQQAGPSTEQPKVIYTTYQHQADGRLRYSKAFGDLIVDLEGQSVQNVAVSGVFGDVEIKLHGCIPADGLNRLVISGFIGDLRILVPRDLEIFAHCSNFIGDIDLLGKRVAGFGNNMDAQTAGYNGAPKRLYIAASNFIGDIRVMLV